MALIKYAERELWLEVVYWGPGLGGKTTNLEVLRQSEDLEVLEHRAPFGATAVVHRGARTIRDFQVRIRLHATPGSLFRDAARTYMVRGVDGLVFVCDSEAQAWERNLDWVVQLDEALAHWGDSLAKLPHVIQYNKRDVPGAVPVERLRAAVNRYGAPEFEAVASQGRGVVETFDALVVGMMRRLRAA